MRQEEFHKVLRKYKKGQCTPEEEALVELWFRSMGADEPSLPASEKQDIKQRSWYRLQDYIRHSGNMNEENPEQSFRLRSVLSWAAAAAVLLAVVSGVFLIVTPEQKRAQTSSVESPEKMITNNTERVMEVLLNDSTRVFLEPESRIFFQEPFLATRRLVELEGEAFFAVSKDVSRPFLVNTNDVVTKVLGTSFTVSAFPHDENITVSVRTGKVSVITKKEESATTRVLQETILTPNQKVIYNKNLHTVSRAIVNEPVQILPPEVVKRMHFEAAPIREIFQGLEDVYGVDIEFDERTFSSCILTTSIAEGTIYNRLNMICKAIDAQYSLKEDKIIVTGRGCDK